MRLHGWVYSFESGSVDIYDPLLGKFVPIDQHLRYKMLEEAKSNRNKTERTAWNTHI